MLFPPISHLPRILLFCHFINSHLKSHLPYTQFIILTLFNSFIFYNIYFQFSKYSFYSFLFEFYFVISIFSTYTPTWRMSYILHVTDVTPPPYVYSVITIVYKPNAFHLQRATRCLNISLLEGNLQ